MDRTEKLLAAFIALALIAIGVLVWYAHQGPCGPGKHPGVVSYAPEMRKKEILMVPNMGCTP